MEKLTDMKAANRLDGIGEYYFSQKLREIAGLNSMGKNIINLGIGSPDLPPHPEVIRVLHEESARHENHAYQSYKGSPVFRAAIAGWYSRWYAVELDPEQEILPLIGSKEGIMHICMTYLNTGDAVLVPDPGYPTYKSAAAIAGAVCIPYTLSAQTNWYPNFAQLEQEDLRTVKLMFVNYPHMPTGQPATNELFDNLVAFAKKHGILLVHDNPYSFILNDNPKSLLAAAGARDCAIELNSLSKSHNMAGWRIGMVCGAKKFIDEILRFKSNMDSGMFLPAQLAAARALSLGRQWHDDVNKTYQARQQKVFELLDLLECRFAPQQSGMFVWAAIPPLFKNGYELSDKVLYQSNVFITPGGIFGPAGEQYIRISLCSSEENITQAGVRIKNSL